METFAFCGKSLSLQSISLQVLLGQGNGSGLLYAPTELTNLQIPERNPYIIPL